MAVSAMVRTAHAVWLGLHPRKEWYQLSNMPNRLIHTTSPYLLQHAHQPVDWYPWGEEALTKAQEEDKPLLVSIGYATCHWCHVMAKETFENEAVAAIMNTYFVCIKVDREERPDIDQVYVAAVQAMGLQAGWPLHIFLLPDQQPFYGGLYFTTTVWENLLIQVKSAFNDHRAPLSAAAFQFTQTLNAPEASCYKCESPAEIFNQKYIEQQFLKIYQVLDHEQGGIRGTPKFPMPSIGSFLLHYYCLTQDARALAQLNLTLQHMACGGIYDQLGGGFSRYATDNAWRIPHFEKMLYDNGQLLSLYTQAYTVTKRPLYKKIALETIAFVEREMVNTAGGFCSALDADSEGAEGKFYTWTKKEIEKVLGECAQPFIAHFSITDTGNWEQGSNILYQKVDRSLATAEHTNIARAIKQLFAVRAQKKHPTKDDKIIASWNGIMLQGLLDAYHAWGGAYLLELALKNAHFIERYLLQGNQLWHSHSKGKAGAPGYLEDYAWVARAFISLYQITFQEHWLHTAETLIQHALLHFYDAEAGLFCFVQHSEATLIARTKEVSDHVIPSSNSVICHDLLMLGALLHNKTYTDTARKMLCTMLPQINHAPLYSSHWAVLYMLQLKPMVVVAMVGPACKEWTKEMKKHVPSGILFAGAVEASSLPLLIDKKPMASKTTIYVCHQGICHAPTHSVKDALAQLAQIT
jgi:uncharacterized protein